MVHELLQDTHDGVSNSKSMIVIGIDPGTGSSSPTGILIYDTETLEILYAAEIGASHRDVDRRIKKIVDSLRPIFQTLIDANYKFLTSIEYFVMAGKSGEMLHRLIGGILTLIPEDMPIIHIQNTTVKLIVGGDGRADKAQVARGVYAHFYSNEVSRKIVDEALFLGHYDKLDAGAIAIGGYHRWLNPNVKKPKKKRPKKLP